MMTRLFLNGASHRRGIKILMQSSSARKSLGDREFNGVKSVSPDTPDLGCSLGMPKIALTNGPSYVTIRISEPNNGFLGGIFFPSTHGWLFTDPLFKLYFFHHRPIR
ncbi:hypothetical protein [Stieleria varia]|uniref:Uncharacterized protein n=1 Tax=Stieleria varia TaxID=2528005 RepID=A0A5C6B1A9_9BACT|nr:hypothetical protein [Stieleria varia]TWU05660.1 hypothetical protein Pla52n_13750 [Stieleria varia]